MNLVVRVAVIVWLISAPAAAQDSPAADQQSEASPSTAGWMLTTDANIFAGFNYQLRRFADFAAWESQNWFMGTVRRPVGAGQLAVSAMLSLEPLTTGHYVYTIGGSRFRAPGSPQLFQTGETFDGAPILDYQHPHDLITGLGATFRLPRRRVTYVFGVDVVGAPTLGPVPFMHRESARNNPQAPLAHHNLDSTHSTAGVVRGGVEVADWTFEVSAFRGEEPDEQRYDIDQPRLDSWAARVSWRRGRWRAQFSGGLLNEPEWFAPYDQGRFTASVGFVGAVAARPMALTAAWGQIREYAVNLGSSDAYLLEWDLQVTPAQAMYGRAEFAEKELFRHVHVGGVTEPHFYYGVTALTVGTVRDLQFLGLNRIGQFGIGGDVTLYRMPTVLEGLYGGSRSFHAFVRWRPRGGAEPHVH
jgi:hypothetical protein